MQYCGIGHPWPLWWKMIVKYQSPYLLSVLLSIYVLGKEHKFFMWNPHPKILENETCTIANVLRLILMII